MKNQEKQQTNPFSNSYLILAAGNQTRWKIGTGIPKVTTGLSKKSDQWPELSNKETMNEYLKRVYPEGDWNSWTKEQVAEAELIRDNNETLKEYNKRIQDLIAEHS